MPCNRAAMFTPSPIRSPSTFLDHVAEVNADPEDDAAVLGHAGIALDHGVLNFDREAHVVDALRNSTIAPSPVRLTTRPFMHGDGRVDEVAAQRAQSRERAILVRAGEPGKADDVGSKDRREFTGFGHGLLRRNAY